METLAYQKEIKANKEHRCDFCAEKIFSGDTYMKSTHKHDGDVYDWKTHKHCSDLAHDLKMYDDADDGVTQDAFIEIVSNNYFDLMAGLFPESEVIKYSEVLKQLRYVRFREKLHYVIINQRKSLLTKENTGGEKG